MIQKGTLVWAECRRRFDVKAESGRRFDPKVVVGLTTDCLFSRVETDARRKREKHWIKKFALVAKFFFAVTRIRLIWLDILIARVNREEKNHAESLADWTNRHILEKWTLKKKKSNLSVSCLIIKSLWFDRKWIELLFSNRRSISTVLQIDLSCLMSNQAKICREPLYLCIKTEEKLIFFFWYTVIQRMTCSVLGR